MTLSTVSQVSDLSDLDELFEPQGLYLKPIARLNISVQLPTVKTPGKSISNWEVMEKLRYIVKPDHFISLKVSKSTLEFIRFEGEVENKALIKTFIARLEGKIMKLSGFPEALKIRAAESKIPFPSRHDWDSFFRDAKNIDEMKPGERPDTIHFKDLPCRWFSNKKGTEKDRPHEYILMKVFETFGKVRCVDIPMLDPYRCEIPSNKVNGISTFNFCNSDLTCEAYVQFVEYIGFVKAMTALKGMKLVFKIFDKIDEDKVTAYAANLKIDFDKTRHLSDKSIKKRAIETERIIQLERAKVERAKREKEEEERKRDEERRWIEEEAKERERKRLEKLAKREERRKQREEKRRQIRLEEKQREEERKIAENIALEERKILIARRKLESIHMLTELFNRIKSVKEAEEAANKVKELEAEVLRQAEIAKQAKIEEERQRQNAEIAEKERLLQQEMQLREKILRNVKKRNEKRSIEEKERLRKELSQKGINRLKSSVVMLNHKS